MGRAERRVHCLLMRYRYRSAALLGAWQTSPERACLDAIRARQAHRNEDGAITWQGSATIEAAAAGGIARRVG